jgi:ATP-dependent Clp protease adapter protein ClpS
MRSSFASWLSLALALGPARTASALVLPALVQRTAEAVARIPAAEAALNQRVNVLSVHRRAQQTAMCATPARYRVYLENDSYNMREFVARVLMMVCHISESEAASIMTGADWGGRALVGTWEKELAEHTYDGMTKAGLRASIVAEAPVDDSRDNIDIL